MKDKVSELRDILNQKKTMNAHKQNLNPDSQEDPANTPDDNFDTTQSDMPELGLDEDNQQNTESEQLQLKIAELKKAGEIQKDMYLRQLAEFDNVRKRLEKEHEEFRKYANEKILTEILPVIDNLEMTLAHTQDETDPIPAGVRLTLKQFLQVLEKFGVKQISGENETFDPNLQEAIGTENVPELGSGKVTKVLRKGYTLNGKLIRAAMVMVSE